MTTVPPPSPVQVERPRTRRVSINEDDIECFKMPMSTSAILARSPDTITAQPEAYPEEFRLPKAQRMKNAAYIKARHPKAQRMKSASRAKARLLTGGAVAGVLSLLVGLRKMDGLQVSIGDGLPILDGLTLDSKLFGAMAAGFTAQVVDGALGMGFGLTSTTIMVSIADLSPLAASTAVHLAQLGTTAVSGFSHYTCGNVDRPTVTRLAPPAVLGAFAGATFLSSMPASAAVPIASGLLFALGGYLLGRCCLQGLPQHEPGSSKPPSRKLLIPLGLWGGFVDATGGGGWGPVATTGLLASGRLSPARVVGTVSAVEFLVTVAAVAGFVGQLGVHLDRLGARIDLLVALLLGGLAAAPIAPLLVQTLEPSTLGVAIGGFICLTNARVLVKAVGVPAHVAAGVYAALLLLWATALAIRLHRTRSAAATAPTSDAPKGDDATIVPPPPSPVAGDEDDLVIAQSLLSPTPRPGLYKLRTSLAPTRDSSLGAVADRESLRSRASHRGRQSIWSSLAEMRLVTDLSPYCDPFELLAIGEK